MSVLRFVVALAAVVVLLVPLNSCGNDAPSSPTLLNSATYSLTYSLTIRRSKSTVSVLTYRDQSGIITVRNPDRRWSIQLSVPSGTTIGMTAQGICDHGSIEIDMSATSTSSTVHDSYSDSASHANLTGVAPCPLSLDDHVLGS